MTNQQIFDRVSRHLLRQAGRAIHQKHYWGHTCAYRAKDGKRCAVGCLIDKKSYRPEFEGLKIEFGGVRGRRLRSAARIRDDQVAFVAELQEIHDACHIQDWPACLKLFANAHNLLNKTVDERTSARCLAAKEV